MNTSITAFAPMWIRCSAWPALQSATAPLVVVLLLGSIFIGPHAMEVRDLGALAESHSKYSAALLLLWSLAMAPAASVALTAPGLRYLRWLPIPAWFGIVHLGLVLILLQLPMPLLLLVAGKPALAIGIWASGVGLSSCLLLPSDTRLEALLTLGIASGILSLLAMHWVPVAGGLGLASAALLLPRHYRRAARPSRRRLRRAWIGGPNFALLGIQGLRLWRCEGALLLRALLLTALGAAMVLLVNRANPGESWSSRMLVSLVTATPCTALMATMMALALRRGQEELRWLRLSLGVSGSRLRRASMFVLLAFLLLFSIALVVAAQQGASYSISQGMALFAALGLHLFFWTIVASLLSYRVVGQGKDQSPAMWAFCIALGDMLLLGFVGPSFLVVESAISILIVLRILSANSREKFVDA